MKSIRALLVPGLLLTFAGLAGATLVQPPAGYRAPVVQKVQMVFSMVSHHSHIPDRINFYNARGIPPGNHNYVVPHLVYEPLITLYNPYPDPLSLRHVRIRIWDPPVGFRFKKNDDWLRSEFATGFHGLARFQIANENNSSARRFFTLMLSGGSTNHLVGRFELQPGEARLFSPRVETSWTWNFETAAGYAPRVFFDWDQNRNFGNEDGRTGNQMGLEAVAGWDPRAGLQTDFISSSTARPEATRYDFERAYGMNGGWVAVKHMDAVSVEARALRTVESPLEPDFRVSVLVGRNPDVSQDIYQDFRFSIAPLLQPPVGSPAAAAISRTYRAGDLLQAPHDLTPGGKSPFAVLTMAAKTRSLLDGSLVRIAEMDGNEHFDLRFDELADFYGAMEIGAVDTVPPVSKPTVIHTSRNGDFLKIAFAAPPGSGPWKAMGSSTLESFDDDLSERASIIPAPPGSFGPGTDLRIAMIDISGLGLKYFVRLEETGGVAD